MTEPRELLLGAVDAALAAVNGRRRVREFLRDRPIDSPVCLISVGKAAPSMAQGAVDALGARIVSGLVVSKRGLEDHPVAGGPSVVHVAAGHPLPDEGSLRAGRLMLELIAGLPRDTTVLFLVSGGASSLVEVLPDGVTLGDLHRANDWLLGAGWDIAVMNGLRKRLSCIKGGRLAGYTGGRLVYNLLISDVPGDDPAVIGSGPLVPGASTPLPEGLPPWLRRLVDVSPPLPDPAAPCLASVQTHIVACSRHAVRAAAAFARARGVAAWGYDAPLTGDVQEVATVIADRLRQGPPGIHVWGGESTLRLPRSPGRGGRNQSLALAVAERVEACPGTGFASVGTDGDDGNTGDAGAVIDGATVAVGRRLGLESTDSLVRADAGTYLERVGALIYTGATGTNVMDLMVGLC